MIHVDQIHYTYPGGESDFALRGISFSLKRGERTAMMGANGSGKSTFIRCLNGLILPDAGFVEVDGMRTDQSGHLFEVRRRVGMVFQNPDNQIVSTTVERELAFGMENIGLSREMMEERVDGALREFHLDEYRASPPHLLSGGERQRLALASVWVMQPDYLILDEPTSLLDPRGRSDVFACLEERFRSRDVGILFVTQFSAEAMRFDRLIIMDKGQIVEDGVPEQVFRKPARMKQLGLEIPADVALSDYL